MKKHLREIRGPVWSMIVWSIVVLVDASLLSIAGGARQSGDHQWAWGLLAAFNLLIVAACLIMGGRTPDLFLKSVLVVRLAGMVCLSLVVGFGSGITFATINAVIVVLYAGFWWHGRILYVYAAAASGSLLLIGLVTNGRNLLIESWLATSTLLFMMAFGLNYLVRQRTDAAQRDSLTGLSNRHALNAYISMFPGPGRSLEPRVLAVLDLDGFKAINDAQGHVVGDALLRNLAHAWQGAIRSDDLLFRIGGDEFLCIFPSTSEADAKEVLARMAAVSPCPWSSGVVVWEASESFDAAFIRADRAMYQDKMGKPRSRSGPAAAIG